MWQASRVVGKKSSVCIQSDLTFTVTASEQAITVLERNIEVTAGSSVKLLSQCLIDAQSRQN